MLSTLRKTKPDLIIMDILIGLEDGRDMCREIKSVHEYAHIPVLFMSGNPENLNDYKAFGADDVIEKPYQLDSMISKIKFFISNQPA